MNYPSGQDEYFNRPGYFLLDEYLEDLKEFNREKTWKLPLSLYDKFQISILKLLNRLVLSKNLICIEHPYLWSPSYSILINYLKKNGYVDNVDIHRSWIEKYYIFISLKNKNGFNLNKKIRGIGVDMSISRALSKCLGELIEREVSFGTTKTKSHIITTFKSLTEQRNRALFPPHYHKFMSNPEKNISEEENVEWVKGLSLIDNKKILLPKQLIFWGEPQATLGKTFYHHTSNGVAGFFNNKKATYNAIMELVQRDAFLVHWLTFNSPILVNKKTLPEYIHAKLEEIENLGIQTYVLDITTDIKIPSICVVLITEKDKRITISASTDINLEEAVNKSIEEAVMCIDNLSRERPHDLPVKPTSFEEFDVSVLQTNRNHLWQGIDWFNAFKWFVEGPTDSYNNLLKKYMNSASSVEEKTLACLSILEEKGQDFHPHIYEYKHKILKKTGFMVVRAFIPGIFPFYLSENYATFNSERLRVFSKFKENSTFKLNKFPHMFP
jgi:thiazole/oxazole-forming peptide maturase SagD family component